MLHNNSYIPSLQHQLEAQNLQDIDVSIIPIKNIKLVNLEHQKQRLSKETDIDMIAFLKNDIKKLENYFKN